MKKQENLETRICNCCRRELPIDCFYRKGNRRDCYCKECRTRKLREKYRLKAAKSFIARKSSSLRIEDITDPKLKLDMILAAKQRVREMYERKYNERRKNETLWQE